MIYLLTAVLAIQPYLTRAAPIPIASGALIAQYWPAYGSWQQSPDQFPWSSTNLAYYFVVSTIAEGIRWPTAETDGEPTEQIGQFVSTAHQNGVKAFVTIGGWTGSKYFSLLVSSDWARRDFAGQIVNFVNTYQFDGVDIDWEYPGLEANPGNIYSPNDAANFLLFLAVLRDSLSPSAILTAAVPLDGNGVSDLRQYAQYLDYVNLMSYDIFGSWSSTTGPNSPLYNCGAFSSVAQGVDTWLNAGFPASKILIGIPAYGISWTTSNSELQTTWPNGVASQFYQGVANPGDRVCVWNCQYKSLLNRALSADGNSGINGFFRTWDSCTSTPFLFNPSTRELISYEDAQSIAAKTAFSNARGLAGIMIFDSIGFTNKEYSAIRNGFSNLGTPIPSSTSYSIYTSTSTKKPKPSSTKISSTKPTSAKPSSSKTKTATYSGLPAVVGNTTLLTSSPSSTQTQSSSTSTTTITSTVYSTSTLISTTYVNFKTSRPVHSRLYPPTITSTSTSN